MKAAPIVLDRGLRSLMHGMIGSIMYSCPPDRHWSGLPNQTCGKAKPPDRSRTVSGFAAEQ